MPELDWSRNSVFEPSQRYDAAGGMNLHMIAEDVGTTLWAQCDRGYRRGEACPLSVRLSFQPHDDRVECLSGLLSAPGYRNGFLDSVGSFVEMMAATIVRDGQFVYELCFGRHPETRVLEEVAFAPVFAPGGQVLRFGSRIVQVLPASVARARARARLIRLDARRTFLFRAPRRWKWPLFRARAASRAFDAVQGGWARRLTDSVRGLGTVEDFGRLRRSNCDVGQSDGAYRLDCTGAFQRLFH